MMKSIQLIDSFEEIHTLVKFLTDIHYHEIPYSYDQVSPLMEFITSMNFITLIQFIHLDETQLNP